MSATEGLFEELAEPAVASAPASEAPVRPRLAQRDQPEFQVVDLDSLLTSDHPARAVWAFTETLELSSLLAAIKARVGGAMRSEPTCVAAGAARFVPGASR